MNEINAKVDVPPVMIKSAEKLVGLSLEISSSSESTHFSEDNIVFSRSLSSPLSDTSKRAADTSCTNGEPLGNT